MSRWRSGLEEIYEVASVGRRVPAMEGIRGLAVTLVFFVHFHSLFCTRLPPASTTYRILNAAQMVGHSGVDMFFLLSGYLIYAMVRSGKQGPRQFLVRRIQRIYPTFLTVFLGYLVCMAIRPDVSKLPGSIAGTLAYLAANLLFLPGLFTIGCMITVAWSLSYEAFYYVALPLVYGGLRMKWWGAGARSACFAGLAAAYCACATIWPGISWPWLALLPMQHPRLIMFAAGILVWEAIPAWRNRLGRGFEVAAAALGVFPLIAIPFLRGHISAVAQAAMLFFTFGFAAISCLGQPKGLLARGLSLTPLRWLGNMSYSYYLLHGMVLYGLVFALRHVLRGAPTTAPVVWATLPVAFALTWAGSTALFVTVEKPLSLAQRTRRQLAASAVQSQASAD